MLPLGLFRSRAFSAGNAASFLTIAALFSAVFFLAQFLQTGLGHDPLGAGLRLLPWTATLFFVAPVAGALVDRFGERPFLAGGLTLQAIGLGWIALVAEPGDGLHRARPGADDRRLRRLDGDAGGDQNAVIDAVRAAGARQGGGRQQHAARARRRVRDRDRRRGVRRRRRLRVAAGVRRRLHRRDRWSPPGSRWPARWRASSYLRGGASPPRPPRSPRRRSASRSTSLVESSIAVASETSAASSSPARRSNSERAACSGT